MRMENEGYFGALAIVNSAVCVSATPIANQYNWVHARICSCSWCHEKDRLSFLLRLMWMRHVHRAIPWPELRIHFSHRLRLNWRRAIRIDDYCSSNIRYVISPWHLLFIVVHFVIGHFFLSRTTHRHSLRLCMCVCVCVRFVPSSFDFCTIVK